MTTQSAASGSSALRNGPSSLSAGFVGRTSGRFLDNARRGLTWSREVLSLLAVVVLLGSLAVPATAQQINFNTFNSPQGALSSPFSTGCPAGTNILFCANYVGAGPSFIQDFYPPAIDPFAATDAGAGSTNYALQLNPNAGSQTSSTWFSIPQDVVDGFTTWYTFKINFQADYTAGHYFTADGMAFVIQKAAGGKVDAISNCTVTGLGPTVLGGGGGCLGYGGIDNSLALEMDTFYDSWDPQENSQGATYDDNHLALQSCGLDGNGNPIANSPAHLGTPNCLVTLGDGTSTLISNPLSSGTSSPTSPPSTNVTLADGSPHQIVMVYNGPHDSPANYLWVYLDATYIPGTHTPVAGSIPVFSGPFDITQYMKLTRGNGSYSPAYVGFTAGTGGDWEQHEVMGWTFTPHANQSYFGPVNVCPLGQTTPAPCNETFNFTYNFPNGATLAAPQIVTQGVAGLDFTLNPNGTTCTGTIAPGSCTVSVTFAPLTPGMRMGAIKLFDTLGNLQASTPIYGAGQGPAAAIGPGVPSIINTTSTYPLSGPRGVMTDAGGNVFISDTANSRVVKVAADGTVSTVGVGLQFPQGLAEDGAGNVYIADNNLNEVVEVPAGCTSSACQQYLGGNLRSQLGVAVDGTGNLFIGDFKDGEVVESPAGCTTASCQTVVYSGGGGSQPVEFALDALGDLFIADFGLAKVVEVPAGCSSASCRVNLGQSWSQPEAVAIDAAGDLFVADLGLAAVVELPVGCTTLNCLTPVKSGVSVFSLAIDGQGDVFVPDQASSQVYKIARSQPPTLSFATTTPGSTSSDSPKSVTLQNIGNQPLIAAGPGVASPTLVNVTGPNFSAVQGPGVPADCAASVSLTPGQACNLSLRFAPLTSGNFAGSATFTDNALNSVFATQTIALQGAGVSPSFPLTVSEIGSGTGTVTDSLQLISCSEANGATTGNCSANYSSGSQLTLTATATGTSKFLGWGGACATAGTSPSCTITVAQAASVTASFVNANFGNINVCPANANSPGTCSSTMPVTFTLLTTSTIGAIQVVTQGVAGLDFSQGSGSTCVGTVAAGNSCTVNVNFAPIAPGLRMGAVQLYDSDANLVASTSIFGAGQGPVAAFNPGTQATLSATLPAGANGIAVDAAGNVFIAHASGAIKVTPSGVQTTYPLTGLGATGLYDLAVDGAGNVYFADSNNNRIIEIAPSGVQTNVPVAGLNFPSGVKVDGSGNLFITDRDNNRVVKLTPDGVQTTVPTNGLVHPYYPAVDVAGDVFFLDNGSQRVLKVTPAGIQSTVPFNGLVAANGLAVDAAGDVYVSDQSLNQIFEITPGGVQTTVPTSALKVPAGLAVDGAGDLFIAVNGQSRIAVVIRSQTPSLTFATTNVGSTSSDSPQSVTLQNIGNQPLTGTEALNLGGNFTQTPVANCPNSLLLAPGAICSVGISFIPQSATFQSGSVVFTDNSLNNLPASQTIAFSGVGAVGGVAGTVAVPNLIGQVQTAVTAPITAVGLVVGTVSTASSSTVPSGSIISQSPDPATQVAVGSAVNLLVSSGIAQPPSANPLTFENNYFVTGDYVASGVTLRGRGVAGMATGNITVQSYASNPANGVPDGADIVDAFLYWETLENTPFASSNNATFNGYSIVGQQIGNDLPNYVDGQMTGTIRSYRAAVNAYLPVRSDGNRIVSGTYTVSLPDGGGATLPLTEGASLVMVYRVLSQNFPLKSVVIYDGSVAPTVPGTQVVQGFYDAVDGANGIGKSTNLFTSGGNWNSTANTVTLGKSNQYSAPLNPASAYAAVILSTPVNNSDNDGILNAWKTGPAAGDFHAGQPGYYDAKTATWVGLPGAKHGQKDLFVQLDYMCGGVLANGACDPTKENLFPSPDTNGNDPLVMVQQAFANSGVQLHLQIGNIVPEDTCVDNTSTAQGLCQFPNQPGVIGWKNSLEFSKLYPKNLYSCLTGGDCTTRFPYGQKDSYHYVLMGHSLAIPAWNSRYGTLTSIKVAKGVTTIGTVDRGPGINACPRRITLSGVIGDPSLNGVYNTTGCADTKTISLLTPGVPDYTYPNNILPEPVIGLTSGTITSISGYSDLGGADSAVTLGLWLTAPNQDMSKKANVLAGTIFHEIGHTLGLGHGGLYFDTPGSYIPTFDANCKPNYQSVMNYLFQLDLLGSSHTLAYSNQTLNTVNENAAGSVTRLADALGNAATFPTSAWYVPYTTGSPVSAATRHCDGTPLTGDAAYRVDSSIAPITPAWSNGQDLSFLGSLQANERGYNDLTSMDLRQVGATGGQFAALATVLSFGASAAPLNIGANGNVTLGSGATISLGSGGNVTLGSGGNVTLGSGGTITLGSGGNVTLGSGGNVTLGSGGTITLGSGGNVTLGSGGNVTLGSGGTITLGSGGTITLGSGGNVTLGSGGTITLGSGGTIAVPSTGGTYSIDGSGGTITLGSGGNVTLGSGGNVTLGSGGTITLGSGGNVTLGSGGNVTLGSGGTITLGSGGNVTLGSGGNVTLGSGGTITLGSGGTITLGSGGNVTLGSGGTVTLGSGGNTAAGDAGNVTLGSGGSATLGADGTVTLGSGGNITLGSGGNVTLGSGGNVTLGSGGTITFGSGGNVTLGSGGNVTLGSGGNVTLGSGGTITLGSGGTVTIGSAGTITLGSGGVIVVPSGGGTYSVGAGGTITLGSGGNVTLGSGGNITLGSGGTITLGSGGNVTLGSGGNVTLGSGGTITLGSGGTVTLGSGGTITLGSGGNVTLGSGGVVTLGNGGSVIQGIGSTIGLSSVSNVTPASAGPSSSTDTELTYETANSVVRPPSLPTETSTPTGIRITWTAPAFGVVQTYTIYRSSNGATPIVIGSVSGTNGNPPATEFTDTNPDTTSKTVVYTVTTTLVPDTGGPPRQSVPSPPAVLKNDQSIVLNPLPSSVVITNPPTITATAFSGSAPNGLQVVFSATGSCSIARQSLVGKVSSATLILTSAGSCTVIAAQPGSTSFNPANSVSGTFMVLAKGSSTMSQMIMFSSLPKAQYGGSFTLSATSSAGLPISYTASGPCTTSGVITGVGVCSITASAPASGGYSAASLTQSFNIYPAVLQVTANNLSTTYGQPLPALTYTYAGFVRSDTASVVSGAPALSTSATASSNTGSYPITVSTGTLASANYSFLYVTGTLTVNPANQSALTLKTTSPLTSNQSETLTVAGGSTGGAVTYNLLSGPCAISGSRLTANGGTGTCQVTATMAGNSNYNAVTSTPANLVTLSLASQTITFTTNPPASAAYASTFKVAATGGASGNAVTFTSAGACSNSGATYTMTNSIGSCSVIVNQAGNTNYAAAPPVTKIVTATGPLVGISTSAIDFGTVALGSITTKFITLTNIGTAPLTITDPILSIVKGGTSDEFIALSLCPRPLAVGKSCTVTIAFLAGPHYTQQTATLQIMSNAPGSPQPIALTALVTTPITSISPSSLDFGTVKQGSGKTLSVTLTNSGGTPLILAANGISITGTNASSFTQTNTCGRLLPARLQCNISVKFTPHSLGKSAATLTVTEGILSGGDTKTIQLSGTGN